MCSSTAIVYADPAVFGARHEVLEPVHTARLSAVELIAEVPQEITREIKRGKTAVVRTGRPTRDDRLTKASPREHRYKMTILQKRLGLAQLFRASSAPCSLCRFD